MANSRRHTHEIKVGTTGIGGSNPVRVQSMTTTATLDTEGSVAQAARLAEAGAELVRLTAQGVAHAKNLEEIQTRLRDGGVSVPLVADIHFNPAAAYEAAMHVEKVRINPGNFYDPGRTFRKMEFTDEEYAAEVANIGGKLRPFLALCRDHGTALRIGVNHGSLSDRIMSRYGDGARGMVESALEYLRICREEGFEDVVVSIKASDVTLMVDTVRLLAQTLDAEGLDYPIHLGVTEAGNAAEGRIKSAVGIGALLAEGIGDTIRVSLSEDPVAEIPVARRIVEYTSSIAPFRTAPKPLHRPVPPEILTRPEDRALLLRPHKAIAEALDRYAEAGAPVALEMDYSEITDPESLTIAVAVDLGYLLMSGAVKSVHLTSGLKQEENEAILRATVQATGLARFKAEIVACPGCGRTLFDLPVALEAVKNAFGHLKHLKIAVMGCIVNGPGEMAGADYGYVGAAAGNVSVYRGITPVYRNVKPTEALMLLADLIKSDGQWTAPEE